MDLPIFEFLQGLRLATCGECGTTYAVPIGLFLSATEAKPIYCPHGHAWTPPPENDASASKTILRLHTAWTDTLMQLEAARRRIQELTPLGNPSRAEIRRRSNLLASKAESKQFGRAICPFCGKQKNESRLAEHIRRTHLEALIEKEI